jgi:hypothetical protein
MKGFPGREGILSGEVHKFMTRTIQRIGGLAAWLGGVLILMVSFAAMAGAQSAGSSFEGEWSTPVTKLDELVEKGLRARGLEPAAACSDSVFLRRVYLDVIGTLPEVSAVEVFLKDERPGKRAALIDALLERDEYADYWAMRWGDVLRIKSEFPINLWPNAVQAYHRWVRDGLRANKSYDEFARELLTSSGSNFRVPPVNFYRAVQGKEPDALAQAVALTFLCSRLEEWPEDRKDGLVALFSRVAFKGTAEWKEEIVLFDPAVTEGLTGMMPDGSTVELSAEQDPRLAFAEWLVSGSGSEWFSRAMVNRAWAWFFGRGFVHEADDIRPENPPVHPEGLDFLAAEFASGGYDVKQLYRLILNSRTYQQSCVPRKPGKESNELFACYPIRHIDAEVLIDALCQLTGTRERYTSPIPEPFTFIPEDQRTIALADGSITSAFLEMFGRPPRDTGLLSERNSRPSDAQRLHLLNSTHVQRKIEKSWKLGALVKKRGRKRGGIVRSIYLAVLSRPPSPAETRMVLDYMRSSGVKGKQATDDLVWALINTKEFLYHH